MEVFSDTACLMVDTITVAIPRIATPRLVLRAYKPSDFPPYAENAADAEAVAFTGGVVDSRAAWRFFCAGTGGWVLGTGGWLAVTLPAEDRMIGVVGAFRREIAPDIVEVGWTIFRADWRKGYGAEAAKAMVDLALDDWKEKRVIAYIAAANTASAGVARNIGMTPDGEGSFYGEPCPRWAVSRR